MQKKTSSKINKKQTQKEITANNNEIHTILQNNVATEKENVRLHFLTKRNSELRSLLHPFPSIPQNYLHYETPNTQLIEIEKKYNAIHDGSETDGYCQNCGTPNGNNVMDGKPWCFKCNRPLIVTYKKPPQKPNPKLKSVRVTVEEQNAFFQRQKQLGIVQ